MELGGKGERRCKQKLQTLVLTSLWLKKKKKINCRNVVELQKNTQIYVLSFDSMNLGALQPAQFLNKADWGVPDSDWARPHTVLSAQKASPIQPWWSERMLCVIAFSIRTVQWWSERNFSSSFFSCRQEKIRTRGHRICSQSLCFLMYRLQSVGSQLKSCN